jgi:hypothetical protein
MVSSAPAAMTKKRAKAKKAPELVLNLGPVPQENLDACARVLARLAVEKAIETLGLDTGRTIGDNVGNPHKAAPPGVRAPDGAKEQVL